MGKYCYWVKIALTSFISIILIWMNVRLWTVSATAYLPTKLGPDILFQLNDIKQRLIAGEGETMQYLFPEGWFFSHILYGYAWINVALASDAETLRQEVIQEVRWVLNQADTPQGQAPFSANTQVSNGVFYLGWTNRLLGGLLKIQTPSEQSPGDIERFHNQSAELAEAFANSFTVHLDAYPGQTWPCDQTVALASLALHDELYGSQYKQAIAKWVNYTQENLDHQTGLIPHKINALNGQIQIGTRGSSQVYLLSFLPELDQAFAREQYALFRNLFVPQVLGFLPVREYPLGSGGQADIDSGPLFFGIGPTSTIVSIAAARANGDYQLFESTLLLTEILGFPTVQSQKKSYGFGLLLVADCFLAWGKSLVPWTEINQVSYTEKPLELQPWLWSLGSGACLLVLWALVVKCRRK